MDKENTKIPPDLAEYSKECSRRLEKLIAESGLKQYQVAEKVSFGSAMVSHYCKGRKFLNAEAIIEFCNALQCQPTEIDPQRKIFKLNIHSRSHINNLLDNASVDKIKLIEQVIAEIVGSKP